MISKALIQMTYGNHIKYDIFHDIFILIDAKKSFNQKVQSTIVDIHYLSQASKWSSVLDILFRLGLATFAVVADHGNLVGLGDLVVLCICFRVS